MKGPLSYIGGKNRLASTILRQLPPHLTYVEPFGGGAQLLFRKEPSRIEILNDLDGELVNFYRVCQSHYQELVRYMRFMLLSRRWFTLLQKTAPDSLTDIQRAARYFYLQKSAYGGLVRRQSYAIHVIQKPNLSAARLETVIEQTHRRLQHVQIECLPYAQILQKYDRPRTFFYLDPPYYGVRLYRYNLEPDDFERLAENLKALRGKFLLSINDDPAIRRMFSHFQIEPVRLSYSLHSKPGRQYQELFVRNY